MPRLLPQPFALASAHAFFSAEFASWVPSGCLLIIRLPFAAPPWLSREELLGRNADASAAPTSVSNNCECTASGAAAYCTSAVATCEFGLTGSTTCGSGGLVGVVSV